MEISPQSVPICVPFKMLQGTRLFVFVRNDRKQPVHLVNKNFLAANDRSGYYEWLT